MAMASPASLAVGLFVRLSLRQGFLLEERLSVSDRYLIVIRMNLGESQEAVAIPAIVDESGLQRWFYAGDLGEIDITSKGPLACGLEVKLLDAIAPQDHHPGFLGV